MVIWNRYFKQPTLIQNVHFMDLVAILKMIKSEIITVTCI